jgi:hypothetical protein
MGAPLSKSDIREFERICEKEPMVAKFTLAFTAIMTFIILYLIFSS